MVLSNMASPRAPRRSFVRARMQRDKAQRPDAGHEKVPTATHRDELWQLRLARGRRMRLWFAEAIGSRPVGERFTVTEQWIALSFEAGKAAVHQPGILHELELAQDVRPEADEVQTTGLDIAVADRLALTAVAEKRGYVIKDDIVTVCGTRFKLIG